MNAAAIDVFQNLQINRKFDELVSDVKESLRQVMGAGIPLSRIVEEAGDEPGLCKIWETGIGSEGMITLTMPPRNGIQQWSMAEFVERKRDQVPQDSFAWKYKRHFATYQQSCRLLVSRWVQSRASIAVLNLGTLHACAQLLFTLRKNTKAADNATARSIRKRNLIICLGQIAPLIAVWIDFSSHRQDLGSQWFQNIVEEMGMVLSTAICVAFGALGLSVYADLDGSFGLMYAPLYDLLITFVVSARYFGALVFVLFVKKGMARRCFLMPCTPVEIEELDQVFAMVAALTCVVYDFAEVIWKFFLSLKSRLKIRFGGADNEVVLPAMSS